LEDYFTGGFHAQQAAEKYIKAFLVRHQVEFPKLTILNDCGN
jgi:HEPN domain-containing protein